MSAQCWDCSGSLKVLEFWEVLTHPQIRRMSPAVSVARCCWQGYPSVPVQSWEVKQEKLLNWLRLQWEMSSPGECVPGSGAASPFCQSHRRRAWEQSWDSCVSGVRDGRHGPCSAISLHTHQGLKGRLEQPGLSSAGSTRKCAALWGGEAKPVLQQISVLYLQPPL